MTQQRQAGADRFQFPTRPSHHHHHQPADPEPIRAHNKPARHRRAARPYKSVLLLRSLPFALILSLVLFLAASLLLLLVPHREIERRLDEDGEKKASDSGVKLDLRSSAWPRTLQFGHSGASGAAGRDSRYWDRDDRRRDWEYNGEDESENESERRDSKNGRSRKEEVSERQENKGGGGGRLYNEGGRAELDSYKEEYEASLRNGGREGKENAGDEDVGFDEYDDGIDVEDEHDDREQSDGAGSDVSGLLAGAQDGSVGKVSKDVAGKNQKKVPSVVPRRVGSRTEHGLAGGDAGKASGSERKSGSKRKPKRTSCEIRFINSTAQLVEPLENKKFSRFSLQYTDVENRPNGLESWEPRFAGHQSLQEREESYYARDQKINCGFIKGRSGSPSAGFDMAEDDIRFMGSCHIAVASCIFGNSDNLRIPYGKMITRQSRKNVCFVMFVDESTLQTLLSEGQKMDGTGYIGLWKIVVVKNLPYTDMRRVGKIPKLLAHRLFPSARYSIWLDSKLRLQSDPLLILEYFLWRRGYEYAISNHYDRHCVWEEVMQNKKLNKFNHTIIDQQFEFYQADGLKRFDPSDPSRLLPSYVPEGSFIVRAHTPMSNLFSCLWFNEVDRFTPRDQLSFAYTYLKLRRMNPSKPFYLNMFKDCERRAIAKLFHHRGEDKRSIPTKPMR